MNPFCRVDCRKSWVTILLAGWFASHGNASETLDDHTHSPRYSAGGSFQHAQGIFGFELGNDTLGTWSKIEWPLSGILGGVECEGGWPLDGDRMVAVSVRYGRSLSMTGTSTDRDWRPWERPDVSDSSETDFSGTIQALDVRVGFRFPVARLDLTLLTGYSRSAVDFEDNNLTGIYDYGANPITSEGPVDTYSASLAGLSVGGEISARMHEKLALAIRVETLMNLSVNADADWIRQGNSFSQDASGTGLAIAGKADYRMREHLTLRTEVEWTARSAHGRQAGTQDGESYDLDIVRQISMEYMTTEIAVIFDF